MLGDRFGRNRPERVEPDVERDGSLMNATFSECGQQFGSKVQARGGSGGRPWLAGKNGLVAVDVRRDRHALANVAGQGHMPHAGQDRGEWPLLVGHGQPAAAGRPVDEVQHPGVDIGPVSEHDPLARVHSATGLGQDHPGPGMLFVAGCPQEQAFPGTTGLQSPTAQSSWQDLRVVHDE